MKKKFLILFFIISSILLFSSSFIIINIFAGSIIITKSILHKIILYYIVLFLLSFYIFKKITTTILSPIYDDINIDILKNKNISELLPVEKLIITQDSIRKKNDKYYDKQISQISLLLNNITEGMALFDKEAKTIMLNPAIKNLLDLKEGDYVGKSYLVLSRNPQFVDAIKSAYEKNSNTKIMDIKDLKLRVFATPVLEKDSVGAVFCIITDITALYEKERHRTEFTANVSHELKTPLTSIIGYSELIKEGIATPEDTKIFAQKIHHQANTLLLMINDIIKLSRIDTHTKIPFEKFNFSFLVTSAIISLKIYADSKNIVLESNIEKNIVYDGNESMILDLVNNLIKNAIDYKDCNKENGYVKVALYKKDSEIFFIVEDNGIGIRKEEQERIFERFYTVDKSRSKNSGGSGLGLSIVKHVVMLHKATIRLESEYKQGSKFTVIFKM